jgi:flagellar biosynthetic protein FliO
MKIFGRALLFSLALSLSASPWLARRAAAAAPTAAAHTPASPDAAEAAPPPLSEARPAAPPDPAADEPLPFMEQTGPEAQAEGLRAAGLLARTLGALLLIVGLMVAAAWCMRRFGGPRFGAQRRGADELSVVASVSLGDRRSLSVVRFGERTLLLGSTPQAITLLSEGAAAGSREDDLPHTPARSVADILNDDEGDEFAHELSLASQRLGPAGETGLSSGRTPA